MSEELSLCGKSERPSVDVFAGPFSAEGWITRAGKFLPCDVEMLHGMMAGLALGGDEKTAERRAERMGWLRISNSGDRMCRPLNQAQQNTLFDYCEAMHRDYKETVSAIQLF